MISTSGKTFGERGRESCQRQQVPHDKAVRNDKALGEDSGVGRSNTRNSMAFRSDKRHFRRMPIGRQKIEKRSFLEVLALKVPFGNRVALPNEVPWPGRLRALLRAL